MILGYVGHLATPPLFRASLWMLAVAFCLVPDGWLLFVLSSWWSIGITAGAIILGALKPRFVEEILGRAFGKLIFRSEAVRGIWLSEYRYRSSPDRRRPLSSQHYAEITTFRSKVYVRSLPRADGSMFRINLDRDGNLLTGTWEEKTSQGTIYFGAIQLIVVPTAKEISGLWVGYTRAFGMQAGEWRFTQVSTTSSRKDRAFYAAQGRSFK